MSKKAKLSSDEALKLTYVERIEVIDEILQSLVTSCSTPFPAMIRMLQGWVAVVDRIRLCFPAIRTST